MSIKIITVLAVAMLFGSTAVASAKPLAHHHRPLNGYTYTAPGFRIWPPAGRSYYDYAPSFARGSGYYSYEAPTPGW